MAREMKDSGIEWIGEIPIRWGTPKTVNRFGFIGSGTTPRTYEDNYYVDGEISWIQSGDLHGKYLKSTSRRITKMAFAQTSTLKMYFPEYLVMAMYGASVGNLSIATIEACTNQACCVLTGEKDNLKYMYYVLTAAKEYLVYSAVGGTQPNISQNVIKNLRIPLPLIDEQKKIADFLEQKCVGLDTLIEKTRASIEEYKKLKQAVITQAVTKGIKGGREMKDSGIEWIGEIPSEWKIIKIKWVLSERKEKSENGGEEPLSMSQKYGIIPTREMEMIPNMASSFIGAKIVHSGDLVFNKLKAHLGVFAVSKYNGIVSPDYAVYCTKGTADVKYLEYLFKTPQYIAEFRKRSSGVGTGLTRLYTDELYSIYCLLPSWNEQEEIICYLNKKIKEIDNLIEKKEQYLSEIENYKKSLIYEYVTGKKEV